MGNAKPKIIFWGTPEFAIPPLQILIEHDYHIVAVVTNPDEPAGRKQVITPSPVKVWAQKHKIPILQPKSLKIENFPPEADPPLAEKLELPEADLYVVVAYGKIIPKIIVDSPKYGSLNVHPSLLPRWRGPSPIQYAILNGDTETGVTIIKMDELMDHGPILAKRELANYELQITNYKNLHNKLANLGAELLIEILPKYLSGEIKPRPQNESETTYSKILKKDDGRIDWSQPAEKIERMVRAFTPWPGAWTVWPSDKKFTRLRIEEAGAVEEESTEGSPGYVWHTEDNPMLIKTGSGNLAIKKLTREGKKSMDAEDFLRGYPQITGAALI